MTLPSPSDGRGRVAVAVIGCGFVADLYMTSLARHPNLQVVGAMDVDRRQVDRFAAFWRIPGYYDRESLLAGAPFEMVLNLTNPAAHYEVSAFFLEAGKHVYSEKPIALRLEQAEALGAIARRRGVRLAAAPCLHLGEAVEAMRRELEAGRIGRPLLAYAEMDDGLVARAPYRSWRSLSGAPWPYEDEFEVGVTLEHAGYSLGALLALFGPVRRVVSFAALVRRGKPVRQGAVEGQDFSLAALEFESGVVARLTCSNIAPRDHAIEVIGEEGVLRARDCWSYRTRVESRRYLTVGKRLLLSPWARRARLRPHGPRARRRGAGSMDFARGPAELAAAIRAGRASRVEFDFALHVNEIALAIDAGVRGGPVEHLTRTRFAPLRRGPEPDA